MKIITSFATSRSMYLSVDSSAGGKKTGLAFNTAGLKAYYTGIQANPVQITLVTQTANGAWSSGGFCEVSSANAPGLYRLDVPDAVWATGGFVVSLFGATGMVQVDKEVQVDGILDHPTGDGTYSHRQIIRLMAAALFGEINIFAGTNANISQVDNISFTRIAAQISATGRTSVFLFPGSQ